MGIALSAPGLPAFSPRGSMDPLASPEEVCNSQLLEWFTDEAGGSLDLACWPDLPLRRPPGFTRKCRR